MMTKDEQISDLIKRVEELEHITRLAKDCLESLAGYGLARKQLLELEELLKKYNISLN